MFELNLPKKFVPDRAVRVQTIKAGDVHTYADLKGPGCIRRMWWGMGYKLLDNRQVIMRIYFDGSETPHVDMPLGDLFGVMHGIPYYEINTPFVTAKDKSGYQIYFPMPFAKSCRIELECQHGEIHGMYAHIDWHRYVDEPLEEPLRFCSRWRRENPTERYSDDFLMCDINGPGLLAGFAYGLRLTDDDDRWSHGGAENIYIDGGGKHPAFIRGTGGEDAFGGSYGGALHKPETHLYAGLPYYVHEDVSQARPAHRLVGYRFFYPDLIPFQESLQMRFGCMRNEICSTTWWYQEGAPREFFKMPGYAQRIPGSELLKGTLDLPLPDTGSWWICGPFGRKNRTAIKKTLEVETLEVDVDATYDGHHKKDSMWLQPKNVEYGRNVARWKKKAAIRNFVEFRHDFRPTSRGPSPTEEGIALARCNVKARKAGVGKMQLTWDDQLAVQINDGGWQFLGYHDAFRSGEIELPLVKGDNRIQIKLDNTKNSNYGGWLFAAQMFDVDGNRLTPDAPQPRRRLSRASAPKV